MQDIVKPHPVSSSAPTPQPKSSPASRAQRLLAHAAAARAKMGDGYGTDVTELSAEDYKARVRRLMLRG